MKVGRFGVVRSSRRAGHWSKAWYFVTLPNSRPEPTPLKTMPDGLLQLASTIFLTFGLGTLLYAIVMYFLRHLVREEPRARQTQGPVYPMPPHTVSQPFYGHPYGQTHGGAYPPAAHPQAPQGYPGYPVQHPQGFPPQMTPQTPPGYPGYPPQRPG